MDSVFVYDNKYVLIGDFQKIQGELMVAINLLKAQQEWHLSRWPMDVPEQIDKFLDERNKDK